MQFSGNCPFHLSMKMGTSLVLSFGLQRGEPNPIKMGHGLNPNPEGRNWSLIASDLLGKVNLIANNRTPNWILLRQPLSFSTPSYSDEPWNLLDSPKLCKWSDEMIGGSEWSNKNGSSLFFFSFFLGEKCVIPTGKQMGPTNQILYFLAPLSLSFSLFVLGVKPTFRRRFEVWGLRCENLWQIRRRSTSFSSTARNAKNLPTKLLLNPIPSLFKPSNGGPFLFPFLFRFLTPPSVQISSLRSLIFCYLLYMYSSFHHLFPANLHHSPTLILPLPFVTLFRIFTHFNYFTFLYNCSLPVLVLQSQYYYFSSLSQCLYLCLTHILAGFNQKKTRYLDI